MWRQTENNLWKLIREAEWAERWETCCVFITERSQQGHASDSESFYTSFIHGTLFTSELLKPQRGGSASGCFQTYRMKSTTLCLLSVLHAGGWADTASVWTSERVAQSGGSIFRATWLQFVPCWFLEVIQSFAGGKARQLHSDTFYQKSSVSWLKKMKWKAVWKLTWGSFPKHQATTDL